jgi:hypothetical protein
VPAPTCADSTPPLHRSTTHDSCATRCTSTVSQQETPPPTFTHPGACRSLQPLCARTSRSRSRRIQRWLCSGNQLLSGLEHPQRPTSAGEFASERYWPPRALMPDIGPDPDSAVVDLPAVHELALPAMPVLAAPQGHSQYIRGSGGARRPRSAGAGHDRCRSW